MSEPESRVDPADSAIDRTRLSDLVGGNPDKIERYLTMFIDVTATSLSQLSDAVARRDTEGVRRLAHKIKGSCSMVGAAGLAAIAGDMERLALGGQLDGIPQLHARLQTAFDATRTAVGQAETATP